MSSKMADAIKQLIQDRGISIDLVMRTIEDSLLARSEEHTSELQSHSFISYAVFCLKKKIKEINLIGQDTTL